MKIEIKKLPENGVHVEETESAKKLGLEYPLCQFKDPVKLHFFVSQVSGDLLVQGSIQTQAHIQCSRCLNDFVFPINLKNFTFCEPIDEQLIIDLTDPIKEDIMLSLPSKPLCDEACEGLCASCGQNLNVKKCQCDKSVHHLWVTDLGKLKLDK